MPKIKEENATKDPSIYNGSYKVQGSNSKCQYFPHFLDADSWFHFGEPARGVTVRLYGPMMENGQRRHIATTRIL